MLVVFSQPGGSGQAKAPVHMGTELRDADLCTKNPPIANRKLLKNKL
jgi:hypothetical protein